MQKRNRKTKSYEPYSVPSDWNCPLMTDDMDEIVNCANCGKTMTFGSGYTSRSIHTQYGFGYSVCRECYEKERE